MAKCGCLGGQSAAGGYLNDVWYSTDGVNWTLATDSAGWSPRDELTSLSYDDKLWVLGGDNGYAFYDDIWYSTGAAIAEPSPAGRASVALRVAPNPFIVSTQIVFAGAASGADRVDVYDALGREVRRLRVGNLQPDTNAVEWNGTDNSGVTVPPGVYVVVLAKEHSGGVSKTAVVRVSR